MDSIHNDTEDGKQSRLTVAASTPEEANRKAAEILTDGAFNAVLLRDYGNMESMPELSVLYPSQPCCLQRWHDVGGTQFKAVCARG